MIRRSHLIGVARNPDLEALRYDGHRAGRAPEHVRSSPQTGPCISGTICPDYALAAARDGSLYCTICHTYQPGSSGWGDLVLGAGLDRAPGIGD